MAFNKTLSLYIPSVPGHLAYPDGIKHYLQRYGHIKAVDIVGAPGRDSVFRAFVHFNEWYDDEYSRNMQNMVMDKNIVAKVENDDEEGYFILLPKIIKAVQETTTVVDNVPSLNCMVHYPPLETKVAPNVSVQEENIDTALSDEARELQNMGKMGSWE